MFFSLAQTLVCVLLINGGLYALHLTGGGNAGSGGNSGGVGINSNGGGVGVGVERGGGATNNGATSGSMMNVLSSSHGSKGLKQPQPPNIDSSGRLAEEIADMAQLERERLMLLGLAKQTAAVNIATGHHGRPIITGRIQMTPAEEAESEYPGLLLQQARGLMFGNVVKQPTHHEDYETSDEFDGGGIQGRPLKYEYGRVVQPSERQVQPEERPQEYDPQHMDLDAFMELETEPDVDDMIPDLDGYQYLDELLAEQNKQERHDWEREHPSRFNHHAPRRQNPYQTLEELESNPPLALQEFFEKEQRDEAVKQHNKQINAGVYNTRMQQNWQRKRSQQRQQQQQQYPRNIFGHSKQQHHYNAPLSKLSLANSEATATKHIGSAYASAHANGAASQSSSASAPGSAPTASSAANPTSTDSASATAQNAQTLKLQGPQMPAKSHTADAAAASKAQQQQQQQQLLHPNHKRSGGIGGMSSAAMGPFGGMQLPVSHPIAASQLMLRSARGQRQYDVPQIECPTAMDGMERFACPTPDLQGRYRCIDDHVLCDGFIDCPEGEDEDRRSCMFYKTTKAHLDVLADALLRWARGR